MREQLIKYVELLFAGTPNSYDMQQEILQNTLDRYDDLIDQGKTPEAAYRLAIAGIGDVGEILGAPPAPTNAPKAENADYRGRPLPSARKKTMRAIAIGMYICCVIPLFILGNIGNGVWGLCLMFVIIAAATVLIILSSSGSREESAKHNEKEPKDPLYKAYKTLSGVITLVIYLGISFWSGAWYITWLVFPISGAIDGIVKAIFDLKEAK